MSLQHQSDLCVSVGIKLPHNCCTSRHLSNGRGVLYTPVIQLNTSAVLRMQVQSLELRTNVLAAYVCGGHADEVRWCLCVAGAR